MIQEKTRITFMETEFSQMFLLCLFSLVAEIPQFVLIVCLFDCLLVFFQNVNNIGLMTDN